MIKNLPSGLVSSVKDVLKTSSEHLKEREQKDLERLQQVKSNTDQIMEKLIGNQHKIDKNKNKKIDAHDFALLRKEKTSIKKEETELIDEAKRLIHHEQGDTYSAKVYRDPEYNEYQVHFFKHGKHMGEGPVSYHDDKEDAISTSKSALKQMHAKDKEVKEESDLHEAKTINNPKIHDLRHLKSSRAVYDATQAGYRDNEGNDREVKDGDVIHTLKGVGILNQAWPVHHSGSEDAFHKLKPGYSMHTIDDGKYKKSVELANSVTKQNLKQTMKHDTGGMVGPKGKLPEEFEQIDELSKKTLRSYMAKAVGSKAAHDYGAGLAAAYDLDDRKNKFLKKSNKRADGLIRAIVKTTKEEVELIDELSQEKMTSYMRAAKKDINKNLRSGDPQPGSKRAAKVEKRVAGYRKAWAKVEQQNEEKDTPGNGYSHQCALHVKSEQFGEGRTLFSQHAEPDADGNIAWYDVMFDEGIKRVYTNEIEILVSEAHMNHKKKKTM